MQLCTPWLKYWVLQWSQKGPISFLFGFIIVCSTISNASHDRETHNPLNIDQLMLLSQGTFNIGINKSQRIQFTGQWPQICAEGSNIKSQRSKIGIGLRILVTNSCLRLLSQSKKSMRLQKQSPFDSLKTEEFVYSSDFVYLESLNSKLDLSIPSTTYENILNADSNTANDPTLEIPGIFSNKQRSQNSFESEMKYRKCDPFDYGGNNPWLCNGRYGLDLSVDYRFMRNAKLRGTTQFDVTTRENRFDMDGKTGIRIDVLINLENFKSE